MSYGIAPAKHTKVVTYKNGATPDIMREVLDANAEKSVWLQVRQFAKQFSRDYDGLCDLYWWLKNNIRYVEDPTGVQWIREPSRLWEDKQGDCKSFTLFLCAVARNMGIPYTIRFVTYSPASKVVTHVYPIFHLDGRDVIMDAVWTDFDSHKTPFYLKKDYTFMEISRLGSIGSGIGAAERTLKAMQNASDYMAKVAKGLPQINDGVDITKLSEAEAIAYLTGGQVSGIGSSLPAFVLPTLTMGDGVNGIGANIFQKAGAAIKKAATQVITKIKDTISSVINFVFKTALKTAGPFFLFAFIGKKISARIDAKRVKQQKIISFISKLTGTSEAVTMASIADGIKKATGKTPQEALNAVAAGQKVAGLAGTEGVGIVITASMVTAVVAIVQKLITFFKKKNSDAPEVSAEAGSDTSMLAMDAAQKLVANESTGIIPSNVPRMADKLPNAEEARDTNPTVENGGALVKKTATTEGDKKDNSMLMWGGAALVGLYLMSQSKN